MEASQLHNLKNKLFVAQNCVKTMMTLIDQDRFDREALQKKIFLTDQTLGDILNIVVSGQSHRRLLRDLSSSLKSSIEKIQDLPIRVILEMNNSSPVLVHEDSVSSLVLNIVKNALEAGAKICVFSLKSSTLTIIDDGIGLDDFRLQMIQKDQMFTTKLKGSGQGIRAIHQVSSSQGWTCQIGHGQDNIEYTGLKFIIKF